MIIRTLGRVLRPHGRHGELQVALAVPQIPEGAVVYLQSSSGARQGPFVLCKIRPHKGIWILRLDQCRSLIQAQEARGHALVSDRVGLPEGFLWVQDLLGMAVITSDGEKLGNLKEIVGAPAHDLFVVWTGEKEILLPALKSVITWIDHRQRRITVTLLPGLREIF